MTTDEVDSLDDLATKVDDYCCNFWLVSTLLTH